MPIASIDLFYADGVVRVSFRPYVSGDVLIAFREQVGDLSLEELRERLEAAAGEWKVKMELQILPK